MLLCNAGPSRSPYVAQYHESATLFWNELQERAPSIQDSDRVISLPTATFFGDCYRMKSAYMRRECYPAFLGFVKEHVMSRRNLEEAIKIFGAPGVGKSTFLVEVLLLALQLNLRVVHTYQRDKSSTDSVISYCYARGKPVEFVRRLASEWLDVPNTLYVCDSASIPPALRCAVVVVCSPGGTSRYKTIEGPTYIMPPWSLEELLICRERVYPEVSVAKVEEYYQRWGGSARFVLGYPSRGRDRMCSSSELRNTVHRCPDVAALMTAVARGDSPQHVAHTLVHFVPVDETYLDASYELCSPEAADIITSNMLSNLKSESAVIETILGLTREGNGKVVAQLYESYVLRRISQGVSMEARLLSQDHLNAPEFISLELSSSPVKYFRALNREILEGVHPSALLVPMKSNFASIDALTPSGIMFQVTVAEEHPIKAEYVSDYLNTIGNPASSILVFVVPEGKGAKFVAQSWLSSNDTPYKRVRRSLPPQYVVEM